MTNDDRVANSFNKMVKDNSFFGKDNVTELIENWKDLDNIKTVLDKYNMFDLIVMNPPYERGLHLKILLLAADKSTHCVSIQPGNFVFNVEYNDRLNICNNLLHVQNAKRINKTDFINMFDNTCQSSCGVILTLNKNIDKTLVQYKHEINTVEKKLHNELKKYKTLNNFFTSAKKDFYVPCPFIHGHQGGSDMYEVVSKKCSVNGDTSGYHVYFDTYNEAQNFLNVFKSDIYRFIVSLYKFAINVPYDKLPWLNDYTQPWTDERLMKAFNLSQDDIEYIRNEMKYYSYNSVNKK